MATTYLPVQACYQVRIAADEQRIQIRPKSAAGGLQKYQLRDLEERLELPEDLTPTVNNARRNLSRRFSQSIRRSWRSKFSSEEEEKSIVNENESTEKVKPVVKQRDWSGELDEDDVDQGRRSTENCIIWAESATDIGRYWRFITSND